MVDIDNIGNLKKCRIWTEKLPITECESVKVLKSIGEANEYICSENQNIAVELFIAPRYYAFLGIEYVFQKRNNLEVCVHITESYDGVLPNSLALPSDNVHLGISNEYAKTILSTAVKVCNNLRTLPSGVLTFSIGAYSDYGSNQVIFSKVTSILVRLLVAKQNSIDLKQLKTIVRNELEKSLIEI